MTNKEYINMLEEAVTVHANAPVNPIVKWEGKGELPTTMDSEDINYLVDKIVKGDGVTDKFIGSPSATKSGVSVKEGETKKSPLSILEKELNEADVLDKQTKKEPDVEADLTEDMDFTNQESNILSRLITEMGELEANFSTQDDDLLDTDDVGGDDVLATPGEDYELDDILDNDYYV